MGMWRDGPPQLPALLQWGNGEEFPSKDLAVDHGCTVPSPGSRRGPSPNTSLLQAGGEGALRGGWRVLITKPRIVPVSFPCLTSWFILSSPPKAGTCRITSPPRTKVLFKLRLKEGRHLMKTLTRFLTPISRLHGPSALHRAGESSAAHQQLLVPGNLLCQRLQNTTKMGLNTKQKKNRLVKFLQDWHN